MAGAFGARWEANGGDGLMLPCVSDTLVASEYRGGPLFLDMLDELTSRLRADGVPWLLDFGDQGAAPAMLMHGWKAVGPWAIATARRQREYHRNPWPRRNVVGLRGVRSGIVVRPHVSAAPLSSLAAMVALNAKLPYQAGIRHVRDLQYLTWRSHNPLARYFYITAGSRELDGYLVAHRTRVDRNDGPTPTTIVDCEASSDHLWLDLIEVGLRLLPGSVLLIWTRDLSPDRIIGLRPLGFELDVPTGRLTRDWHLPNLLVYSTTALTEPSPFVELDTASAWNLRSVCGRCWR